MEEVICRDGQATHLIYYIAQSKDVDEVAEFASEYLFNSTPVREFATFDDPADKEGQFARNQDRLRKCFAQPTSIVVREKSGNVVAFQAMILEEKNDSKPLNNEDEI